MRHSLSASCPPAQFKITGLKARLVFAFVAVVRERFQPSNWKFEQASNGCANVNR